MKDGIIQAESKTYDILLMQIDRISSLIKDLDTSLETYAVSSKLKPVQISSSLEQIKEHLISLAEINNMEFLYEQNLTKDICIMIDFDRLLQVFINLLQNSSKFRNNHPSICKFIVNDLEDNIEFIFADNGIGIKPKEQSYIFNRLYKGDQSRTSLKHSGSGLGLSIAKQIIDYHGGTIDVSNHTLFETGCTITITLPKSHHVSVTPLVHLYPGVEENNKIQEGVI